MTDVTELLTGVLAEHDDLPGIDACSCGAHYTPRTHACGEPDPHRRHLAAVLAPVVARAQAEAWKQGWGTRAHQRYDSDKRPIFTPNPYEET